MSIYDPASMHCNQRHVTTANLVPRSNIYPESSGFWSAGQRPMIQRENNARLVLVTDTHEKKRRKGTWRRVVTWTNSSK